jgi:VWFA-related protein
MQAMYQVLFCLAGMSGMVAGAAAQEQPSVAASNAAVTTTPAAVTTALTPNTKNRHVVLDVVVTDHAGKAVAGLTQKDFTVLDDQQPSDAIYFHAQSGPKLETGDSRTEVVLVVDELNTSYLTASYELGEVKRFLAQNQGELTHPVSLAFLTDKGLETQSVPSLDGNQIIAALDAHQHAMRSSSVGVGSGLYGAEDQTQISLDAMHSLVEKERQRTARKMVVWISPGWPLLSGAHRDLTQGQMEAIYNSAVRLSADLREARITMYSIDPMRGASAGMRTVYYQNFTKGLTDPHHAEVGDLGLQVLVTQSGGRAIFGNDSIFNTLNHTMEDLNAFYVVAIDAPMAERPNTYHTLGIKLGAPGLTARTRTGYYAQP